MIDLQQLKRLSPLDSLTDNGLRQAAEAMTSGRLEEGKTLFNKGDQDKQMFFLIEGTIALRSDPASPPVFIEAGTDAALNPLSRLKPRRYTATAATTVEIAAIDEDLLDNLLTADHTAAYEVTEIEGEDPEWMFKLICSPAFAKVPTANLAPLFSRLQSVETENGQIVVRQGEPGDYYYIIRRGKAQVWRSVNQETPAKVAELGVGCAFGEEALLSGEPRNATIVMIGEGQLMRLSMADFNALLKPALVHRVDPSQAAILIGGGARFLDVRTESEFREFSLPSSINMPLFNLRHQAEKLERQRRYITVCQTGRRSTAAAFLLNQRGFDVRVLEGGLNSINRTA